MKVGDCESGGGRPIQSPRHHISFSDENVCLRPLRVGEPPLRNAHISPISCYPRRRYRAPFRNEVESIRDFRFAWHHLFCSDAARPIHRFEFLSQKDPKLIAVVSRGRVLGPPGISSC
jgi:hypothetical protein